MSDLDNMQHIAASADAGAIEADAAARGPELDENGQPVAVAAPVDYGQEAAAVVDVFSALATGYAPACADIWTPEAKARTAQALGPVLEKYGFSLGTMPPELTLAIVAGPLLWQTARTMATHTAQEKAKARAAQVGQVAAPVQQHQGAAVEAPELKTHPQTALYS
jgi:hypothetical protein